MSHFRSFPPIVPLLVCVVFGGCTRWSPETQDTEFGSEHGWEPAQTVVLLTIDSLNARVFLGQEWDWDVAPNLHALTDESALFPNVLTVQGTTRPALASLLTGLYPTTHGTRTNDSDVFNGITLYERFHDVGYTTLGYSANQCGLLYEDHLDHRSCTWYRELTDGYTLLMRDDLLLSSLLETLPTVPADEPLFLWLHLNHLHKPYEMVSEHFEEFHPNSYLGTVDPADDDNVAQITLGEAEYDYADRRLLEAVYASQLRETDRALGEVLAALEDAGRYDDAIILVGADHGEELAEHNDYFWHGCSPYNGTLQVAYSIRAPGRFEGGDVFDSWVSITDFAPTVAELAAAFDWTGEQEGTSLVDTLLGGELPTHPVFASRSADTAVMIHQGHKYFWSGVREYSDCQPYSDDDSDDVSFSNEYEEIYDLAVDPRERFDLFDQDQALTEELRTTLCEWVQDTNWVHPEAASTNSVAVGCHEWLCGQDSPHCDE